MRRAWLSLSCLSLLLACGPEPVVPAPEAPATAAAPLVLSKLRVSSNGRFLVKADGTPFFWMADTAWQLIPYLNREQAAAYLQNRADLGFTVVQAVVLGPLTGLYSNAQGDVPFLNNNFATPAVTSGSDPANATQYDFWDHVDYVIDQAEARGLYVALLPLWGTLVQDGYLTLSNAQAYGQFLGSRYAGRSIIWVLGGDVSPAGHESVWRALAKGIAIGTSGSEDYSQVLMTFHPKGGARSSTWFHNEAWLDFNMQQNGHCTDTDVYNRIASDYALSPVKPSLDGEPLYEQFPICFNAANGFSNDYEVRKYAYWSVFAGAAGHTYGHNAVWQMYAPGRSPQFNPLSYWNDALNHAGATQMRYLRRLIESRPMLERTPDQALLASSAGSGTQRIQATRSSNGSYAFIYSASGLAFTVNMGRLSGGTVRATWYNPRTGATTVVGTYANTGTRQFTPPGSGAGNDWVLVLDDTTRNYPLPGGTTPPPVNEAYATQSASASPSTVAPGQTVNLSASIQAAGAASGRNVKLNVRDAAGNYLAGAPFSNQSFAQGELKTYSMTYAVPSNLANGTYCLTSGVADASWATWLYWDNCAASFTVSNAPAPQVGFTQVSASTSPTTVARGGTVRLTSTFQAAGAAGGVNVKLDVRNAAGTATVASHPLSNQAFTQGQTRTFQVDYAVPATLTPGSYCLATGVSTGDWASWYVWNSCAATFTVQ
ncbi:DUF4038 domain-containing protein [Corallococcus interemptor]|uniref:apiosidase-like domain-containing protein n=1 Tax=Corallococcus interemptor TaxID=2316720 RepID=UPI003CFC37E5